LTDLSRRTPADREAGWIRGAVLGQSAAEGSFESLPAFTA
jgi:hypothetical protein